ncbi:endonuclease/exonuclease/phosphatase family protein [Micromonospora sp. NPDC048935]|uniref:endonuclease/exonuclease/phosphatase family protein n=1 Tax=Micromonospora sp. NPDC048935 TaxID=3364262 RepID=UPI003723B6E2
MADRRSHRPLRRALAVGCLIAAAALPAGPPVTSSADSTGPTILRVLQMNLCNSGRAGCFTGRSVHRAAEVISAEAPDLVTLNEICRDDVATLERVFATAHTGRRVVSAFQAAGDRPSGGDTRCRNGQPYGLGLLTRMRTTDTPPAVYRGIHPTQDLADPEERAWLCVDVDGVLLACTTHLANTGDGVASPSAATCSTRSCRASAGVPGTRRSCSAATSTSTTAATRTCAPARRRVTNGSTTARGNTSWRRPTSGSVVAGPW